MFRPMPLAKACAPSGTLPAATARCASLPPPVAMREFDESGICRPSFAAYREAMRAFATEVGAPFIDLGAATAANAALGAERCKTRYMWGRANAWAAYTMSQVGVRLPQCYLYPKFLDVVGSLNDQLAALKLYQTENGLWRTIVDDAASYEEVSASAGIAAAMITKGNPLHIKYINKSIPGMLANVSPDGRVLNVSGGTAVMKDADGYRGISRDWIQGWGQGLALAFFAGVLNYDNVRSDGAL